ncbi:MAG: AI-2E family transporter [Mycobacteriales bacterium]
MSTTPDGPLPAPFADGGPAPPGGQLNRETSVPDGAGVRVPVVLVGAAAWGWRILVLVGVLAVLGIVVLHLLLLVVPFATAILATALLTPMTSWMRRRGLGRGLSTLVTILVALAVLSGAVFFVVNRAIAGYPDLADEASRAVTNVQNYLTNGPFHLQHSSIDNIGSTITKKLHAHQGEVASGVISAGRTAFDVVTGAVLFLFLTIFLVYDGDRVWEWVVRLLPRRGEELARGAGQRAWRTLTGYIGGQFLVALFHTVVISATLLILRAPLVAPLALVVFVFSFVPIIGAIVAGAFAIVVVLVAVGPVQAIVLLVVLVVEDQIEGHVLQPLVVGRYVRLHPIAIASTLVVGAIVAGIPGAIFGVPLVAAVNAAAKFLSGREDIDGNAIPRVEDREPGSGSPP